MVAIVGPKKAVSESAIMPAGNWNAVTLMVNVQRLARFMLPVLPELM
jgi:hypothetical protein